MVTLNSNKDLFDNIHNLYGHSLEWATGLANELQLPYSTTLHLCREAGYYRHKLVKNVSLSEFTKQPYAAYVIKKKGLVLV